MIILAAIDNANGMLFNHRRVSRDVVLREKIIDISKNSILRMNTFSAKQFTEGLPDNAVVSDTFLDEAEHGDFGFVEDRHIEPYADKIEAIYLFKWNRDYPSDFKLDFIPADHGFHLASVQDFTGHSHDDITWEVWEK